jgi:phosphoribosylformylglycinamidine (FGAM) synthase-like amidotransferase family enzyme
MAEIEELLVKRAVAMERTTIAIINAVGAHCDNDMHVAMGALGAAAGTLAMSSGRADQFLEGMNTVARGVVSGQFMDEAPK